jgi:HNH endonuclease
MAKRYITKAVRQLIAERAYYLCEYCMCRSDCACESFESEHIMPFVLGGSNEPDNLAFTCRGCNSHKSDRITALDPLTEQSVLLFHPRNHHWYDHFAWDEEYLFIIGTTPIGRASVDALHLNRKGVVNLRRLMKLGGIHPPKNI